VAAIGIVGTGYVGLVSAVCFAKLGHRVIGYDIDSQKIDKIKSGFSPIYEDDLENQLSTLLKTDLLYFTTNLNDLSKCEYVFLCVPTPQDQDGSADLSYVLAATEKLRLVLPKNSCLITKSTVPVESWKLVVNVLDRADVHVISNPEFLREGTAIADFFNPDRIVVGGTNLNKAKAVASLYKSSTIEILITDNTTAELIKYVSNSFLALKLSFVNDIAALSEKVGANVLEVLRGMGLDRRIGEKFITPGPGWGGSCFPKDVRALMITAEESATPMPLLSAAWESNERNHRRFVDLASDYLGGSLVGKNIAVWGLAFKAFTDDVRDSPSLAVIDRLIGRGANVFAYDPVVKSINDNSKVFIKKDIYETLENSDLILILTEWPEFTSIDPELVKNRSNTRKVIDTRGIISKQRWEEAGFTVWGLKH